MDMASTPQENTETILRVFLAQGRIIATPVAVRLSFNALLHKADNLVEALHSLLFRHLLCFRELPIPVAHVPGSRNLRSNVVIQIPGEMKHQMPKAVAEGKRFFPELLIRQRLGQFTYLLTQVRIMTLQARFDSGVQIMI